MTKLIVVVGATGNQGGSVARRFLKAGFRVRGLCRDVNSPAALKLASEGVEVVSVNLDDASTLIPAFSGANVIFSVTNYWEPFFRPDYREKAKERGISPRKIAYEVEYLHGKNIADAAAATVDTLDENGFLASTLSHAGKCSDGKFKELYHFDSKADAFPAYVDERYPALAAKMSCIHTGYFYTSYNILPSCYLGKLPDGSFRMAFTTAPDKVVPHFAPAADMGAFTYAVHQMPPGKAYMAAGTFCTWPEWIETWSRVTGAAASYAQVPYEEMVSAVGEDELGREVADMFTYTSDPGYDGAMDLLTAEDIRKAGIECPMTTWEEWARENDWTSVLGQ
ncbi:related to nitrogen metabolic regulation protein nmr [Cephalotrichum gorgonifer]|uniref:Related to nitrogen metabolic regulation protein nmr n=1 Tax=Cephalotrichum gorgonifer TaxID=2041049 RepID=A0AAE8N3S5_9PEZI|nr:related to nitrogen metabolic regulation protein nmr [Cephalotrichum gorgonifer]